MKDTIELNLTEIRQIIADKYGISIKNVDYVINNEKCIKTICGIIINKGCDGNV